MTFLIHSVIVENLKTGSTRKGYGHYNPENKLIYLSVGTFRLDGTPMVLDLPFKIQNDVEVKAGSCPEPWILKVMETPPPAPPKYKKCTVGASGYIWPEAQRLIKPKTTQGVYTLHPTA